MPVFSIDFETRSPVDLKKAGAHVYAAHPQTDVMCMAWRKDQDAPQLWRAGVLEESADPFPEALLAHIRSGGIVLAHNAAFEHKIWNGPLRRRFPELPEVPVEQWYCTLAAALACGMPGGLDQLAAALRVPYRKDLEGSRALMRLCKPRSILEDGTLVWDTDPTRRDLVYRYCKQDVEVERAVGAHLPILSTAERKIWVLDQRINDRGVAADRRFCELAIPLLELAKRDADRAVSRITHGVVTAVSQTKRMADWITSQGIECTSVAKGQVEELKIEASLMGYPEIRDVLEIKQDANKASTAKYRAFLSCMGSDGRVRGLLQYHGAATGRWAGRLVQPQNFPKIDWDSEGAMVHDTVDIVLWEGVSAADKITALRLSADVSPFRALSKALRQVFVADAGKKLVGGDWSNIEGRINAWLAGEEWLLQAFKEFDAGIGPDLYKVTAAKTLNKRIEDVTKLERQNYGKIPFLACGYMGGAGAFLSMGRNFGVQVPEEDAKGIVKDWREANKAIKNNWYSVQDAAVAAVRSPGSVVHCCGKRVAYYMDGKEWLVCRLPSGRTLRYRMPFLEKRMTPWGEERDTLFAWGQNSLTKQWEPYSLYGGILVENLCQAISACILRAAMVACERLGKPVVLTVHDELVLELDADDPFSERDLLAIMKEPEPWMAGLPIAAECWEGLRYGK